MATLRYYFLGTAPDPAVTPTTDGWITSSPNHTYKRGTMSRTVLDPAGPASFRSQTVGKPSGVGRVMGWQFISDDALSAGEVSGTLNFAVTWSDSAHQDIHTGHSLRVRVVSPDGQTTRGILHDGPLELPAIAVPSDENNRQMAGGTNWIRNAALTPVTAQAGDLLVAEYGINTSFDPNWPAHSTQYGAPSDYADLSLAVRQGAGGDAKRGFLELVLDDPPVAPTGLAVVETTATTATVDWVAPTTGPTPDSYEYRIDGGAPVDVGTNTGATLSGLDPQTTYSIEVRSVAGTATSAWAGPLPVTTLADGMPVRVGETKVAQMFVGGDEVIEIYLGSTRLWGKA